jgi:NADH-quinone oxidoreductase subunit L
MTHAFFKALLFLGAGSVIHALHGEQDLRKMGGLAPRMVTTTVTMTIGAAGLGGVFGLAGFFSKDAILESAYGAGRLGLWSLLLLGAFLTAFYTSRLLFLAFFAPPRMSREAAHHVHESPAVMTAPLVLLAVLTLAAGVAVGIPGDRGTPFARFLQPVFGRPGAEHGESAVHPLLLLALSQIVVAAGILLAWLLYMSRPLPPDTIGRARTPLHALLLNAYYVDRIYDAVLVRPFYAVSRFLARTIDLGVIDGAVNGVGDAVLGWARGLRRLQTGFVVNYALTMLLGVVALIGFVLSR